MLLFCMQKFFKSFIELEDFSNLEYLILKNFSKFQQTINFSIEKNSNIENYKIFCDNIKFYSMILENTPILKNNKHFLLLKYKYSQSFASGKNLNELIKNESFESFLQWYYLRKKN